MPPIKKFRYRFTAVINDEIWHIEIKRISGRWKRRAEYEREQKEDV